MSTKWRDRGGIPVGVMVALMIYPTTPAAAETLRGSRGEILGHMRDEGSSVRLTDAQYKTLGYYLRPRNVKVDAGYRVIGPGNQLGRLLGR